MCKQRPLLWEVELCMYQAVPEGKEAALESYNPTDNKVRAFPLKCLCRGHSILTTHCLGSIFKVWSLSRVNQTLIKYRPRAKKKFLLDGLLNR